MVLILQVLSLNKLILLCFILDLLVLVLKNLNNLHIRMYVLLVLVNLDYFNHVLIIVFLLILELLICRKKVCIMNVRALLVNIILRVMMMKRSLKLLLNLGMDNGILLFGQVKILIRQLFIKIVNFIISLNVVLHLEDQVFSVLCLMFNL